MNCGAINTQVGIGLEPTLQGWVDNIVLVAREVWRVLRDDGLFFLNLGDAYAGSGRGHAEYHANPGLSKSFERGGDTRRKQQGNAGSLNLVPDKRVIKPGGSKGSHVKPTSDEGSGRFSKNLMGQPWRVAFALQDEGWVLRSANVWQKLNPMPESVTDRPTSAYEMVFQFAKSADTLFWTHRDLPGTRVMPQPDYRYLDQTTDEEFLEEPKDGLDEVIECPDCQGTGEIVIQVGQVSLFDGVPSMVEACGKCGGEGEVKRWRRVNLWKGHDYFYDADAVRQTGTLNDFHSWKKNQANHDRNDGNEPRRQGFAGANLRNVWSIPTQPYRGAHFATFPEALPELCIKAGTSEHGVCASCGAPWARAVEKVSGYEGGRRNDGADKYGTSRGSKWKSSTDLAKANVRSTTLGWRPTCVCAAAVVPATVLDVFAGSGTTLAVSQRLGRHSVGLDLSPEYLTLATRRIGG